MDGRGMGSGVFLGGGVWLGSLVLEWGMAMVMAILGSVDMDY